MTEKNAQPSRVSNLSQLAARESQQPQTAGSPRTTSRSEGPRGPYNPPAVEITMFDYYAAMALAGIDQEVPAKRAAKIAAARAQALMDLREKLGVTR